jgi:5-methylcytosine-specific restriction endonuclease McrA
LSSEASASNQPHIGEWRSLASALRSGRRGRGFKSRFPDHYRSSVGSCYYYDMPYADPEAQRAYQREWVKRRREDWISENGPCIDCSSWEGLTVDHVDASEKVSHRVWSWSKARRDAELAKCVVRCEPCHQTKTTASGEKARGEQHGLHVLATEKVWEVRRRVKAGESQAAVALDVGVDRRHVWDLVHRRSRKYE